MGNILKKCDNFGDEFSLNHGRTKRNQTRVGGTLTLLSLAFIAIASYTFIKNFLSTKDPEISMSTEFDDSYPEINLVDGKLFPMPTINVNNIENILRTDYPKYLTIVGNLMLFNYTLDPTNPVMTYKSILKVEYLPCNEVSHPLKEVLYAGLFTMTGYSETFGLCPKITDDKLYAVRGNSINIPLIYFALEVFPCSLKNPAECKKIEDLRDTKITFYSPVASFSKERYEDPIKFFPDEIFNLHLNRNEGKTIKVKLKKTELYDERVDFVGENLKSEFIDFDSIVMDSVERDPSMITCSEDQIKISGDCKPYIRIEFHSGGKINTIKRNYKKASDLMGDIGGVTEVFFLIFSFLFMVFMVCVPKGKNCPSEKVLGEEKNEVLKRLKIENKKEGEDLLEEFEIRNYDGFEILKNLNELKLLKNVLFDDYHRKLAPLISLNLVKEELEFKKISKGKEAEMSYEEAVRKLIEDKTEDPVKKRINEIFKEKLPKVKKSGNFNFGKKIDLRKNYEFSSKNENFCGDFGIEIFDLDEKRSFGNNKVSDDSRKGNVKFV